MNDNPVILHEFDNGVSEIILNRPHKLNALNADMIAEFIHILQQLAHRRDLRVLVVSGAGKWFCGGADLNWMSNASKLDEHSNLQDARQLASMFSELDKLPAVTIARVRGGAMGGAIGMLCCCDIVVASHDCQFSFGELRLGLLPATILPYVLRSLGPGHTRHLVLSAETFDSTHAKHVGLVHETVSDEMLDERINKHISSVLATAPGASRLCKQTILQSQQALIADPDKAAELLAESRCSDEAREGISAFLDKRRPIWNEDFSGADKPDRNQDD